MGRSWEQFVTELGFGGIGKHVTITVKPCHKVRYGHEQTALKAAESMHKKTGDNYDAYQCPHPPCGAWHIGHSTATT